MGNTSDCPSPSARAAVSTRNSNASLTPGAADADARTVSTAAATSLWGSASWCYTMSFCGPSTGRTRSHGLSFLRSIATAHSSTDRMRWRTARAVSAFTCQIGVRISSTSAVLTSETGRASLRLASACSRASASETSETAPSPSSRRRPRTKTTESALSGWRLGARLRQCEDEQRVSRTRPQLRRQGSEVRRSAAGAGADRHELLPVDGVSNRESGDR